MAISYGPTYLGQSWSFRHDHPGAVSHSITQSACFILLNYNLPFSRAKADPPSCHSCRLCDFHGWLPFSPLCWKILEQDSGCHSLSHSLTSAQWFHQSTIFDRKWIIFLYHCTEVWNSVNGSCQFPKEVWCWREKTRYPLTSGCLRLCVT